MSESFEVAEPILNGPFSEPAHHWLIRPSAMPVKAEGRREAGYWFRTPGKDDADKSSEGTPPSARNITGTVVTSRSSMMRGLVSAR